MSRKWRSAFTAVALYVGNGLIWQSLEMLFYGEIQPRIVDDIMAIFWILLLMRTCNFVYEKGYIDGYRRGYQPPQLCQNNEYIEGEKYDV